MRQVTGEGLGYSNLLNTGFCAQKRITTLGGVTQGHRQPRPECHGSESVEWGWGAAEGGLRGGGRSPKSSARRTSGLTPTVAQPGPRLCDLVKDDDPL